MKAGTLKDRIHIQRRTGGQDAWGTPQPENWENITLNRIAADVRHKSGLSAIKADADVSIVQASARIRHRSDVEAGMRMILGSAVYDIDAVLPGPTKEYVDLVCKLTTGPTA